MPDADPAARLSHDDLALVLAIALKLSDAPDYTFPVTLSARAYAHLTTAAQAAGTSLAAHAGAMLTEALRTWVTHTFPEERDLV